MNIGLLPQAHMHELLKAINPKSRWDGNEDIRLWQAQARDTLSALLGLNRIAEYATEPVMQNELESKDDEWESDNDIVQASVIVNAKSPNDVKRLRRTIRHIIAEYVESIEPPLRPELRSLSNDGIAWDWTKPCYFDTLHYQCEMYLNNEDDEQD